MHLALNPPSRARPRRAAPPGVTIPLDQSSTYPSTEQTLSWLSAVINSGGLGQIGDIVHNFNIALSGHESQSVNIHPAGRHSSACRPASGAKSSHRSNLNRLAGTFAAQRDVISEALRKIPPALERARAANGHASLTALKKLGEFADTDNRFVNATQADLVKNLQNLEPTFAPSQMSDQESGTRYAYAPTFPYTQNCLIAALRGRLSQSSSPSPISPSPASKRTAILGHPMG